MTKQMHVMARHVIAMLRNLIRDLINICYFVSVDVDESQHGLAMENNPFIRKLLGLGTNN